MVSQPPPRLVGLADDPPANPMDSDSDAVAAPPLGLRRRRNAAEGMGASGSPDQPPPKAPLDSSGPPPPAPSSSPPDKSYVESLIGRALRPSRATREHAAAIADVDARFRRHALWNVGAYVVLVAGAYASVPSEDVVRLEGIEQYAAMLAMSLIALSVLSRVAPLVGWGRWDWKGSGGGGGGSGSRNSNNENNNKGSWSWNGAKETWESLSGIYLGGLAVQIVAFATDFLLAFFPTPLVVDPVLGTRVHVLRWCEWAPCAAAMTFMAEGADLYWTGDRPPEDDVRTKYRMAAAQGGAVCLGLLFPFCPGPKSWSTCMAGAMFLYSTLFPRLMRRRREVPEELSPGATVEEAERYASARIALRLRFVTAAVWTIIVALFFASSVVGPRFAPEGSALRDPAVNMICECFFDVLSKVLFLGVIAEVHRAVFDPRARTERRLAELRQLMAAVWESSSDVIAISVRAGPDGGGASTMLSPSFFGLGSEGGPLRNLTAEQIKDLFQRKSVLYQLSSEAFRKKTNAVGNDASSEEHDRTEPEVTPEMIFDIEETGFSSGPAAGELVFDGDVVKPENGALRALSDVVVRAWAQEEREVVFSHDLYWAGGRQGKDHLIRCEAKVSRLDSNALIVIVRDISERVRAFEAEKQMLFETTSRQKDAEANRFTRHEVKNGLLAAIGLYESLCEAQRSQLTSNQNTTRGRASNADSAFDLGEVDVGDDVVRCMNELGKSLYETLDTVLVEAMTRDLVHDLYRPHKEKVNIASVLSGNDQLGSGRVGMNLTRFPLVTRPSPLPPFHFDPSLLRYLHRQALSNACKYGKTGGQILTEIHFDDASQELTIRVINLPGENHDRLVKMGTDAERLVFEKGIQVHETFDGDALSKITKKSQMAAVPGDGAWIIRKCARIMKGDCSIKFEQSRTVFLLRLPAKQIKPRQNTKCYTPVDFRTFSLPDRIWGIAIDDSKVQMKLLGKFFEFAGIQKDRITVFGRDADEIMGFVDYVVSFMDENMGDYVLLIADENLDVMDEGSKHITISGSQLVENIRSRLLPEQEKFLVALIRSANDSSSDVAIYNSRAHGFLPKAPVKKGNVLETLAPLWIARYPEPTGGDDESQSQHSITGSFSSVESFSSLNDFLVSTPVEIIQIVKEINDLISNGSTMENWDMVWEKLHQLKGDLLTLEVGSKVISAIGMINSFRELCSDKEIKDRWGLLQEHILQWLNASN